MRSGTRPLGRQRVPRIGSDPNGPRADRVVHHQQEQVEGRDTGSAQEGGVRTQGPPLPGVVHVAAVVSGGGVAAAAVLVCAVAASVFVAILSLLLLSLLRLHLL